MYTHIYIYLLYVYIYIWIRVSNACAYNTEHYIHCIYIYTHVIVTLYYCNIKSFQILWESPDFESRKSRKSCSRPMQMEGRRMWGSSGWSNGAQDASRTLPLLRCFTLENSCWDVTRKAIMTGLGSQFQLLITQKAGLCVLNVVWHGWWAKSTTATCVTAHIILHTHRYICHAILSNSLKWFHPKIMPNKTPQEPEAIEIFSSHFWKGEWERNCTGRWSPHQNCMFSEVRTRNDWSTSGLWTITGASSRGVKEVVRLKGHNLSPCSCEA